MRHKVNIVVGFSVSGAAAIRRHRTGRLAPFRSTRRQGLGWFIEGEKERVRHDEVKAVKRRA